MRAMSSSWSWLNLSDFSSVAGNTLTGIVTRPKEMAPFHIDRGGIVRTSQGRSEPAEQGRCILTQPGETTSAWALRPARCGYHRRMPSRKKGSGGRALTADLPMQLPAERRGD